MLINQFLYVSLGGRGFVPLGVLEPIIMGLGGHICPPKIPKP